MLSENQLRVSLLLGWFKLAKLITFVILSGCCVAFMYYAGPPEAVEDWSNGFEPRSRNMDAAGAASARRHWHLVRCQNGKSHLL